MVVSSMLTARLWNFYPVVLLWGSVFVLIYAYSMSGVWTISLDLENISLVLFFDKVTFVFVTMTLVVSVNVFTYSIPYMEEDRWKKGFITLLFLFALSMVILSMSGNLFTMMFGWDGLGVTSFCLIVFYQNWKSFNSGVVTFMTNRVGDSCIVVALVTILSGSMDPCWFVEKYNFSLWLFILVGAFSKSAQFPFSSWLPRAMAAPTPVSALVHSSTLVTAGIFVVSRFNELLSEEVKTVIFFVSVISIIISGLSSFGEFDVKKIIALSTLSHIGLVFMTISCGKVEFGLLHMFIHAMFKSTLFLVVGWVIHSSVGEQDIRKLSIWSMSPMVISSFLISLVSMVGFPFLGGFYSKELVMSVFLKGSFIQFFAFLLSSALTMGYSVRLALILLNSSSISPVGTPSESSLVNWCLLFGSILSSVVSGLMVSLFGWTFEFFPMASAWKQVLLLYLVSGFMFGMFGQKFNSIFVGSFSKMWNIESINELLVSFSRSISWNLMFFCGIKGISDLFTKSFSFKDLSISLFSASFVSPFSFIKVICVFPLFIMMMMCL